MLTSCDFVMSMFEMDNTPSYDYDGKKISANQYWSVYDEYMMKYKFDMPNRWKMWGYNNGEAVNYAAIKYENKIVVLNKTNGSSQWYIIEDDKCTVMIEDGSGKRYSIYSSEEISNDIYANPQTLFKDMFVSWKEISERYFDAKTDYRMEEQTNSLLYRFYIETNTDIACLELTIDNYKLTSIEIMLEEGYIQCTFDNISDIIIPSIDEFTLVEK